ncbi:TetR/AcrR family transcriptional regulator [Halomonas sp. MCCC 1A11036]|jgi:AcrR family transcriptional regulator|uniref:TetR/AcrR family transcriptional regulator n=2 Tax=Billgrantia TaxID=3137761 RepID=A0A6I6SG51_9GAMM|nr:MULTISPECIES: TetR/AcrR family transcriptional regulator [Halomonas]MDX5435101.1 TetR/AcrR family transcriptional regulator [Halomonas sp.]MCE8020096.1 TetR/AcrR family transcriptional regulator [Halomonas zhangzhouensis]MCE8032384.1 TetR/AcrR family transcriptional regulator [Halomonas sp. MCCC 1A11057]MDX5504265.1 TetR/AcrR family transcriptional regulator [Halomonas sp.]QHC49638.1 TetR/AcrR family transcriptional regulator [Halomonas tianxiuensis]
MNVVNESPRRKELTRLAAQLFVQEGFDRTTVRMLAQEMGIKSGSLFHHFRDKQEILAAVIEEGTQNALTLAHQALEECGDSADERLHAMARAHLQTLLTDRNAHVVALYEWRRLDAAARAHLSHLRDAYEELWERVIDEALAAGLIHGDRFLVSRFVMGALNWTVRWYDPEGARKPDDLAHELVAMITSSSRAS